MITRRKVQKSVAIGSTHMLQGVLVNKIDESFRATKVQLRIQSCGQASNFVWKCFFTIIDHICAALKQRIAGYKAISDRFGFLSQLSSMCNEDVKAAARKLVEACPDDLEETFPTELFQFTYYLFEPLQPGAHIWRMRVPKRRTRRGPLSY